MLTVPPVIVPPPPPMPTKINSNTAGRLIPAYE